MDQNRSHRSRTRFVVVQSAIVGLVAITQQAVVPFDVCARSDTWTRPSNDVQSKIWNDPRYKALGPGAYEWTHSFLWNEPDSASLTYSDSNLSGVWTDVQESQCPRRDRERALWTEIWSLNFRVAGIVLQDSVYSVTVIPQERGYEIIQFRRPSTLGDELTSLEFVTPSGAVVGRWKETKPNVFVPMPR